MMSVGYDLDQAKKKKKKASSPDQFQRDRLKAEIVSPYKNNWILFVSITIFSLVFFGYLFPELLNKSDSLQIPDLNDLPAPQPFNLKQ